MTLENYLERRGLDPDEEPADLSVMEAVERAVERAYYKACLSDSTHHGVRRSAMVDTLSWVVKTDQYPQFDPDDYSMLDEMTEKLIQERRA